MRCHPDAKAKSISENPSKALGSGSVLDSLKKILEQEDVVDEVEDLFEGQHSSNGIILRRVYARSPPESEKCSL